MLLLRFSKHSKELNMTFSKTGAEALALHQAYLDRAKERDQAARKLQAERHALSQFNATLHTVPPKEAFSTARIRDYDESRARGWTTE
jgi:hypothetical protein